jgi:O-antigen/teichoic acid export membrane protein
MLTRNIKLVFGTNALMLCSGVVTSLLSAWALGPEGRGDLMVVLMWPGIFAMAVEFGLPTAYRFWTAKDPGKVSALFSNAVILTLFFGVAAFGIAWLGIPVLIGHRSALVVRLAQVYALIIPMTLLTDLIRGLLEGARRFQWVAALRLIFFGFQAVSYVALWFLNDLTLDNAMYTMIGSSVTSLVVALVAIHWELKPRWQPRFDELKTTLNYGIRDYPGIVTEFINWRLDLMMLVGMASSTAVGLYSIAVRLSDITTVLASSVGDALMPEVAASKKADEASDTVTRSLRLTLAAHLTLLLPLWLAAPHVLRIAYGESFVPVTNVLRLLMLASVVWSAAAVIISGLNGLGHPLSSTLARISAALVMVILLLMWLPGWGIKGAALASITGYSIMFVVSLLMFLRHQRVTVWHCLRPRIDDIPRNLRPENLRIQLSLMLRRAPKSADALVSGTE